MVVLKLFREEFARMKPVHFAQLEKMFAKVDSDSDGIITYQEFERAIGRLDALNIKQEHIEEMFKEFDINVNETGLQLDDEKKQHDINTTIARGGIAFGDLLQALVHGYLIDCDERLFAAFVQLDKDGDGKITVDQLKMKLKEIDPLGEYDQAMELIKNKKFAKNGKIDYQQFLLALHPAFEQEQSDWYPKVFMRMKSIFNTNQIAPDEKLKNIINDNIDKVEHAQVVGLQKAATVPLQVSYSESSQEKGVSGVSGISGVSQVSHISGLSKLSLSMASIRDDITYYIENPLVIMLGIGEYDSNVLPPLLGVKKDYTSMIYIFHVCFGYSFVFENKLTKKIEYLNKTNKRQVSDANDEKEKEKFSLTECEKQLKTYWIDEEIDTFFGKCKELVVNNNHDSCIFILSCHGDNDGVIIDSKGNEIGLGNLFGPYNGKYCKYLIDKPKIAVLDCCRGKLRSKAIQGKNEESKENSNDDINNIKFKQPKLSLARNLKIKNSVTTAIDEEKDSVSQNDNDDDNNNSSNVNESSLMKINGNAYHEEANFRYIFANPNGYVTPDGGEKGGYLIRAVKKVFLNEKISLEKCLGDIIGDIRHQTQKLAGSKAMECVQDVNTMVYNKVYFKKKFDKKNRVNWRINRTTFN